MIFIFKANSELNKRKIDSFRRKVKTQGKQFFSLKTTQKCWNTNLNR